MERWQWVEITSGYHLIIGILVLAVAGLTLLTAVLQSAAPLLAAPAAAAVPANLPVLVDDFSARSPDGSAGAYQLGGACGSLAATDLVFDAGVVTATVSGAWGGVWMELNPPARGGEPLDFSAVLPPAVLPAYQAQITGLTVQLAAGSVGRPLKVELKNGSTIVWQGVTAVEGGAQTITYALPPLGEITELALVLEQVQTSGYLVVDAITLTVTHQISDVPTAAFVWSYGMLLENWNPDTGLVRDKARESSGDFDAVKATGSLALASATAAQLGVISPESATQIVNRISETLLIDLPAYAGIWPHWVEITPSETITIVADTEWSTVDMAIAALGLLGGQSALQLETAGTEAQLRAIAWADLRTDDGIRHGYDANRQPLSDVWNTFGGESWLVALVYAATQPGGMVPPLAHPLPPTANGSGFIDELAWLYTLPPAVDDVWGNDWESYRTAAAITQTTYYAEEYPGSCFAQLGLFGLSAAEVPVPADVAAEAVYQEFGVGGAAAGGNDGRDLLGHPVVVPHYAALIAPRHPDAAIGMWSWLINAGLFSPLSNVESLLFTSDASCGAANLEWNPLKGSWNLALQTLGWGNYLVMQQQSFPAPWSTTLRNPFVREGYHLLAPGGVQNGYFPAVLRE